MAELAQLLLFDTSSRHLDTLSFGFEKAGCTLVGTSEMETARSLLRASRPSVVIVGVHTGDAQGFDLIRSLGHSADTRNLPCVAFGRPELRNDSVAAGAFGFLSIPIFVSDIIGACRLIAATSSSKERAPADAEVAMKLEEIEGIYHLIRIFSVIGRSAVVHAVQGSRRAELRFIDGALTGIQLGALQGLPALHQLLLWDKAELKLKFKNVGRQGSQLSLKPSEVLEECDRFLRDFAHEVAGLGWSRTIFEPNPSRRPAPNMPSEVVPVLKQFDGKRELAQILEDSPFRLFDTLRIIKRFVADEAIVPRTPPAALTAPSGSRLTGPAALDAWFQRSATDRELHAAVLEGSESVPQVTARSPDGGSDRDRDSDAAATASGKRGDNPREHVTTLKLVPSDERPRQAVVVAEAGVSTTANTPPPTSTVTAPTLSATFATIVTPAAPSSPAAITSRLVPAAAVIEPRPPIDRVTHGEIRVAPATVRKTGSIPAAGTPSVFVDLAGNSPVASVSIAPPAIVDVAPAPIAPPVGLATAAAVHIPAAPAAAVPPPPTVSPAAAPLGRGHAGGLASAASGRPQPRPFDDVESDFFDREADLYRRDSIESFDDLDGMHGRAPSSRNPPGKG